MTSEIRRGWTFILAAAVGVGTSAVALPFYTLGVFVTPLSVDMGWSRSAIQGALMFSIGLGALMAPFLGSLVDRCGSRRIALPSIVGLALAFFLAAAMCPSIWVFYGLYALMAVLGVGTTPTTWSRAVARKFQVQRGLALGLTLTGTGVCAMLAPLYVAWLTELFHWRAAYVGLGVVLLLLTWPLVFFFLKEAPLETDSTASVASRVQDGLTFGEAARTRQFWVLIVSIACAYLAAAAIIANLVPALTDQGFDLSTAAFIQSIIGVSIIVGRLVVGYLIDYLWAPGVAAASLALPIIACVIFQGEPTYALAIVAAACVGFATGAEFDLMAFLTARYFGVRHFGKIYAVYFAMFSLTSGLSPLLFARLQEHMSSYATGFAAAGVLFAFAAAIILTMGKYPTIKCRN